VPDDFTVLDVEGRDVRISNPSKVYFPELGLTKLDVVEYFRSVMPGVLAGSGDRPTMLYRWPEGAAAPEKAFYQKRVPNPPEWMETATVQFPSGRSATFLVVADAAHWAWAVNLGCIEIHPWPVRSADTDHPDELRVDLDPTPDIPFSDVRDVAMEARLVLEEHGLRGFPKTSGKRGIHVFVRIEPRWTFTAVRRAALAFAREVERRMPGVATTAWWKEERVGVFLDYNQNARDRTVAAAYSVRPTPDARVSTPLSWDEVPDVEPSDFTMATVPSRFAATGDPGATIDDHAGSLESLLELARRDAEGGLGDAPWPPHFPKQDDEPKRVQPSRAKEWTPEQEAAWRTGRSLRSRR
jgi:DNA ligase D-like protein (predicted polymerase)